MLRCPPSRINLTASDIAAFEQRLAARQAAKFRLAPSNVRLSPGPARLMRFSVVPATHAAVWYPVAASPSKATVYEHDPEACTMDSSNIDGDDANTFFSPDGIPMHDQQSLPDQTSLHSDVSRATGDNVELQQSPGQVVAAHTVELDEHMRGVGLVEKQCPEKTVPATFDVTPKLYMNIHFVNTTSALPFTERGNPILAEIVSDAYPVQRLPHLEPSLEPQRSSSDQARAILDHSQDIPVYNDSRELQEFLYARNAGATPISSRGRGRNPRAPPEPVLTMEMPQVHYNPTLDPGAPVFVPRTRFGSSARWSQESSGPMRSHPRWASVGHMHAPSDLHVRAYAAPNIDGHPQNRPHTSHPHVSASATDPATHILDAATQRHQRRNRTSGENVSVRSPHSNLERYPVLRPPSASASQHRARGSRRTISSLYTLPRQGSSVYHRSTTYARQESRLNMADQLADSGTYLRSVFPALSISSRSTPNLLHPTYLGPHTDSRSSSLSWTTAPNSPNNYRAPSMVSAASGISAGNATRQSSREALDAATEFLRMRNSPLDELTGRLSRASSSRPRSVGHSWEKLPNLGYRVSLLTGDPFRQEAPSDELPNLADEDAISADAQHLGSEQASSVAEPVTNDLIAYSKALLPSSDTTSSPPATPDAAQTYGDNSSSSAAASGPGLTFDAIPPARRESISIKAAPRVRVYDDGKLPQTQPQTPADVARNRRATARSESTVNQSPLFVGRAVMASQHVEPQTSKHRNTYSPGTSGSAQPQTPVPATTSRVAQAGVSSSLQRSRGRSWISRNPDEAENELEGHLRLLANDRQRWLSRQGQGSLEVTPPRESRAEQYLS